MLFNVFLLIGGLSLLTLVVLTALLLIQRFAPKKCSGCTVVLPRSELQAKCPACARVYTMGYLFGKKEVTDIVKGESKRARKKRLERVKGRKKLYGLIATGAILVLIALTLSPVAYHVYARSMMIYGFNDSPFITELAVEYDYVDSNTELNVTIQITNGWSEPIPHPNYEFVLLIIEEGEIFDLGLKPVEYDPLEDLPSNFTIRPLEVGVISYTMDLTGEKVGECYLILEVHEVHSRGTDGEPSSWDIISRRKMTTEFF